MKIGLGHLRMSPDAFWRMTLPEFFAACDGYMEAKGVKRGATNAPTREECAELFAMAEAKLNG
jgi:uncharacterized phage protein (TIGR02216 family)